MRTFRRKIAVTPLLLSMALIALGIPATAQEVYQQNSSQACCAGQMAAAIQSPAPSGGAAGHTCCPDEQAPGLQADCCRADGADQARCAADCETECAGQPCVPPQGCRPGPQNAPGCCP